MACLSPLPSLLPPSLLLPFLPPSLPSFLPSFPPSLSPSLPPSSFPPSPSLLLPSLSFLPSFLPSFLSSPSSFSFFFFLSLLNYFEREHKSKQVSMCRERGRQRGRERIPSRLCAVSMEPNSGLDPMNLEIVTLAQIKSRKLNPQSHPGA